MTITRDGVDWDAEGLRAPSATWTYLVNDNVFGSNVVLELAVRPSIDGMSAIFLGPVLFVWALYQHWEKHKKRKLQRRKETMHERREIRSSSSSGDSRSI